MNISRHWLNPGLLLCAMLALAIPGVTGELHRDFGFLWSATNWQIGFSFVSHSPADAYWWTIAVGTLNSILLAAVAIFVSTLLGSLVAIVRLSPNPLWRLYGRAYTELFRNIPVILQALFWFTVLTHLPGPRSAWGLGGFLALSNRGLSLPMPTMQGLAALTALVLLAYALVVGRGSGMPPRRAIVLAALAVVAVAVAVYGIGQNGLALIAGPTLRGFNFQGGLAVPSELLAILLGISLFSSAYVTEIIRGGILAIPEGMIEAARALGLSPWAILVKVIFPLAIRSIIIPLGSQYTTIVKLTSLGLAVGYSDLFAVTTASITHSGQTIALVVVMSLCYSVLNLAIVRSVGVVNARLMLPGHRA